MISHETISKQFFEANTRKSIVENAIFFEVKELCHGAKNLNGETLLASFNKDHCKDTVVITISANEEPYQITSDNFLNENFWKQWDELVQNEEGDDLIEFVLRIDKCKNETNYYYIYSTEAFNKTLTGLSEMKFLTFFNPLFFHHNKLFFICPNDSNAKYSTANMIFIDDAKWHAYSFNQEGEFNRNKLTEKFNSVSYFSGIDNCALLPEDFILTKGEYNGDLLEQQFNKAATILLLARLFDYTQLDNNQLRFKLNGYKTLTNTVKTHDLQTDCNSNLFAVYQWIKIGGSIVDKIGLARNLISLNVSKNVGYCIDDSVILSILSGYRVYEKQNVKQYIELRNKMSDQLLSYNEKATKLVENFASGFQKSALAFISLFSTIVVARVLSARNFSNIFTLDATILAEVFLVISLIYFFVCRWEIKVQKQRFISSYYNMKSRNEDLLTKEDIKRILNDDREFNADVKFISDKQRNYSWMWLGFISIFSLVVIMLFLAHLLKESNQQHVLFKLINSL